jgi:predicted AlkP superfamily phosphohydrolase/phosphomutase
VTKRLASALVVALLAGACSRPAPPASHEGFSRAPILLIGLDGFEWNGVLPLLREEKLPAIAALLRRGAYGTLETFPGRVSPALWTSIATGKDVDKHGIYDFLKERTPPVFYASTDRKTKAFWNILSERGRSVDTVGWFVTHPVEPVNGVMVSQANTRENRQTKRTLKGALLPGVAGQVFPPEREAEVFAVVAEVEDDLDAIVRDRLETSSEHPPARLKAIVDASAWAFRADTIYERIATRLASTSAPDLLAVYFGSTDVLAHRFWPTARPRGFPGRLFAGPTGRRLAPRMAPGGIGNGVFGGPYWKALEPQGADAWSVRVLHRTYEGADAAIGRLVAAMPKETTVILVSDHGFRPWGHEDGPDAFFLAAGPNVRAMQGPAPSALTRSHLRRIGSILDVTPTLLALVGIPLGLDMDGRVLDAVLTPLPGTTRPPAVATHDTTEWLASRSRAAPATDTGDDETERLEQLKALGYIK